jgi:hypothetical protein
MISSRADRRNLQGKWFSRSLDVTGDGGEPHILAVILQPRKRGFIHFRSPGQFRKRQTGSLTVFGEKHPDRILAIVLVKICPRLRIPRFARGDEFFDLAHKLGSFRIRFSSGRSA